MYSKAVLQAIEANPVCSTRRVSVEHGITQSNCGSEAGQKHLELQKYYKTFDTTKYKFIFSPNQNKKKKR